MLSRASGRNPAEDSDTDSPAPLLAHLNSHANRWNRTLIRERGAAMGAEFRGKGVHVALAPMAYASFLGSRVWCLLADVHVPHPHPAT